MLKQKQWNSPDPDWGFAFRSLAKNAKIFAFSLNFAFICFAKKFGKGKVLLRLRFFASFIFAKKFVSYE